MASTSTSDKADTELSEDQWYFITQGGTLDGVPPGKGESKLWMLVFTLRESIYKFPTGTVVEEWDEWVDHIKYLTVRE